MLTLKKVKEMVKAPVHTKRVPSPKVLLEDGRILLRKEFEHDSHLTLYHSGYADKCIGFCIEEDGGFVGMYELVVNDKVQRENINSINYFRDDKLVQQAISDMEKLMAARQQSKEQERSNTKKSVLDALRSLKAKKQEQPAQEQDKPKKVKTKGMEL